MKRLGYEVFYISHVTGSGCIHTNSNTKKFPPLRYYKPKPISPKPCQTAPQDQILPRHKTSKISLWSSGPPNGKSENNGWLRFGVNVNCCVNVSCEIRNWFQACDGLLSFQKGSVVFLPIIGKESELIS